MSKADQFRQYAEEAMRWAWSLQCTVRVRPCQPPVRPFRSAPSLPYFSLSSTARYCGSKNTNGVQSPGRDRSNASASPPDRQARPLKTASQGESSKSRNGACSSERISRGDRLRDRHGGWRRQAGWRPVGNHLQGQLATAHGLKE